MNEYLFYTQEGYTEAPLDNVKVENCQVLGRAYGENVQEAKANLLIENPWIENAKFNLDEIKYEIILSDSIKQDILEILQYMFEDECRSFYETEKPKDHIFNTLLRLRDSINATSDFVIDEYNEDE